MRAHDASEWDPSVEGWVQHEWDWDSDLWEVRVGQIETVLRYFGRICSISVEREVVPAYDGSGTDTVYLQAQRVDGGLEVEMTGNAYLLAKPLDEDQVAQMVEWGWTAPCDGSQPNFSRFLSSDADLHDFALQALAAFAEVYGIGPAEEWGINPPEFVIEDACSQEMRVMTPEEIHAQRLQTLRDGTLIEVLELIHSDQVSWEDLIAVGLPRSDVRLEVAMMYRPECPADFFRASSLAFEVVEDLHLPTTVAKALLDSKPEAYEIRRLARRGDLTESDLRQAAQSGLRRARWYGKKAGAFLELSVMAVTTLSRTAKEHEDEAVGLLRHRNCPEGIVHDHVLARPARVRLAALNAVKDRNLAIDSTLIRLAGDLPMRETPDTRFPLAPRVKTLVKEILEAR